jgi:glycosyltransferase involved in cell wall biosynthesis
MSLSVTIAVCTRDHPEDLRRCLAALRGVRGPIAEILVVDNASRTSETKEIACEFGVRYVLEPAPGLHHARNRAARVARGEFIAYTDDDCEPEPGWVEAILAAFRDPDVACVTGKAIAGKNANHAQREFDALSRTFCVDREITTSLIDIGRFLYRGICGVGANMALRRDFLLFCGGFKGTADDDYIFFKVLRSGLKLRYSPNSIVRERHRAGILESAWRCYEYGVGDLHLVWLLGAEDRSLRVVFENGAYLLLINLRQISRDLLHLHATRALFGIAHLTGLLSGLLPPRELRAIVASPGVCASDRH